MVTCLQMSWFGRGIYSCILSTLEGRQGGPQIWSVLRLHNKSRVSLAVKLEFVSPISSQKFETNEVINSCD